MPYAFKDWKAFSGSLKSRRDSFWSSDVYAQPVIFGGSKPCIFSIFFPEHVAIQRGILIGMISHYFLDALTVRGIRFFYPADVRVRLTRMRTGGVGETFLLVGLVVCIGYLFVAF